MKIKMKYLAMMTLVIVSTGLLAAQTKPKSKTRQNEEMPSQAEMEAMMKEAQKEMDNLDPEAKQMMDSMGFRMPSFTNVPQLTDAQLKEAYENENRLVPLKDVARVASISKTPLTNASLPAYISAAHKNVAAQLRPASRAKGEEIWVSLKAEYKSPAAMGNAAAGLWMLGKVELALYVMGRATMEGPTNTDNLNNYASMLSMSGAEQLAIPILNYVNKRFPGNSTVLNNLGQAWFGLGEVDRASVYLDSVIRMSAHHPQANYTKSFIEESKDHQAAALEAAKRGIKMAYSQKKNDRLNKLGYKPKHSDLNWNQPMPQDPLGLEKFRWPAYPKNVLESEALEKEWNTFKATCQQELAALKSRQKKAEEAATAGAKKRMEQLLQAGQRGMAVSPMPPFAPKAMIALGYLVDDRDGHLAISYQKKTEKLAGVYRQVGALEDDLSAQLVLLAERYEDQFGEGKPNPFSAACTEENGLKNKFLSTSNSALEQASLDYLNFLRRKLNDETYYNQYMQWPEQFELTKVNAMISWLTTIYEQKVMFRNKSTWCQPVPEKKPAPFKLAAFDDVNCKYHSRFTTPVGTIQMDCSRWTTTLDLKIVKLGLKQDMDRETFGDQFVSCSVEAGVGAGVGVNAGPLKAEASVGARIAAEFDRNGLSDLVLKTSAGVSAGTDVISNGSMAGVGVSDLSVDVGVSGQVSLISGKSSVESTGILAGAFQK